MSKSRVSAHHLIAGLALIALLALLFALGVAAQDPGSGQAGSVPERVTAVEEVELRADAAAPNQDIFYKRYSADTFTPAFSDMEYSYSTGGCMYRTGGGSYDHTQPHRRQSHKHHNACTAPAADRTIIRLTPCNCPKAPRSPICASTSMTWIPTATP